MKRLAAVALVLVAGCLTPIPPPADPPDEGPAITVPRFDAPSVIATVGAQQGEFPLEITDGGQTILTCTHGGFTEAAPKYVSEDGGQTWRELLVSPPTGVSGDCWVDIGDDGTWYFIDSQVAGNTVSSSTDRGRTWLVNRVSGLPIGGSADRPYLAPIGGASMALTYVQSYLVPGYVVFTRTHDHGETWEEPRRISNVEGTTTNVMHGPMIVSDDGTSIRIPLFQFQPHDYPSMGPAQGSFGFATSTDGGDTWTYDAVMTDVEALFTPPAVAGSGPNLYWAYQVRNGSSQDLMLLTSIDNGTTWRPAIRVAGGIPYIGYMWMDPGPNGTADLSLDADAALIDSAAQGEHLILLRFNATKNTLVEWAVAAAPAENAEFSTIAHDETGRILSSFRHDGNWLLLRETR